MNSFPCTQCGETFTNPRKRMLHHAEVHPKPKRVAEPVPVKRRTKPTLRRATDTWPARP